MYQEKDVKQIDANAHNNHNQHDTDDDDDDEDNIAYNIFHLNKKNKHEYNA